MIDSASITRTICTPQAFLRPSSRVSISKKSPTEARRTVRGGAANQSQGRQSDGPNWVLDKPKRLWEIGSRYWYDRPLTTSRLLCVKHHACVEIRCVSCDLNAIMRPSPMSVFCPTRVINAVPAAALKSRWCCAGCRSTTSSPLSTWMGVCVSRAVLKPCDVCEALRCSWIAFEIVPSQAVCAVLPPCPRELACAAGDRGFDPLRLGATWGNPPDESDSSQSRIGWLVRHRSLAMALVLRAESAVNLIVT